MVATWCFKLRRLTLDVPGEQDSLRIEARLRDMGAEYDFGVFIAAKASVGDVTYPIDCTNVRNAASEEGTCTFSNDARRSLVASNGMILPMGPRRIQLIAKRQDATSIGVTCR